MATLKNTQERFGTITKCLHWISVPIILGLFVLGFWMVELDYYDPWYTKAPSIHKSTGILFTLLLVMRLFWRLINSKPNPIATHRSWEIHIATAIQWFFYVLLFSIVISGYLISTADGRPIDVFGLFSVPALGAFIENQEDLAGDIHQWLAYTLIALVLIHVTASLKHHFYDKDKTLSRML